LTASKKSTENIGGMVDRSISNSNVMRKTDVFEVDVTSTLTTLIIDGISSHSILLDSYVVLYAAFVSSLHKIIGIEFGMRSSFVDIYIVDEHGF
jgi:nucleolar MIF4G domain-containing protein 1